MSKRTLVLGGPGCGKTTALLEIVRDRLQYYAPEEIAYLAFTRKAAYEARGRAVHNLGIESDRLIWFRTLHSMAFKALGLDPGHVMSGPEYDELGRFMNLEFTTPATDDDYGLHLGASEGEILARLEQLCRVTGRPLDKMAPRLGINVYLARFYQRSLEAFKADRYLLDFTDMIERFVTEGGTEALSQVKTVIVDEAQDLSPIHWKALQPLFNRAEEVFIGGDDDQSIFKWAGADVDTFLLMDGRRQVLPVSHRLPINIFNYANQIVGRIKNRIPKDWKPRAEYGQISRLDDFENLPYQDDDWLILARHNYQLVQYIGTLRRQGFVYEYNGRSSTKTEHVPRIIAWEDLRKGRRVEAKKVKDVYKALNAQFLNRKSAKGLRAVEDRVLLGLDRLKQEFGLKDAPPWFDALVMSERESNYYREVLRRARGKTAILSETPRIKVSTIHGVKGGEATNVVLTPDVSRAAFEELEGRATSDNEHRVFYVGATRAKESLYLINPRSNRYYDL